MQSWYLGSNARLTIPGQAGVNPELWDRFVAGADSHYAATGVRTQVNSVMRSTADQRRFWDAYVAYLSGGPWAPLAARPGTSNHERGLAIDAQPAGGLATWGSPWQRAMTDHGLRFPVVGEPWHIELSPSRRPLPQAPVPQAPVTPSPSKEAVMAAAQSGFTFRFYGDPTVWAVGPFGKNGSIARAALGSPGVVAVARGCGYPDIDSLDKPIRDAILTRDGVDVLLRLPVATFSHLTG